MQKAKEKIKALIEKYDKIKSLFLNIKSYRKHEKHFR